MDGNECKTKENIHNNKRKLKITLEKNYLQHIYSLFSNVNIASFLVFVIPKYKKKTFFGKKKHVVLTPGIEPLDHMGLETRFLDMQPAMVIAAC